MKFLSKKTLVEVFIIIIVSCAIGFSANIFHPKRIKIFTTRPALEYAADTVYAVGLPAATISANAESQDSILSNPVYLHIDKITQIIDSEQGILIDARDTEYFEKSHIQSAINIPFANLDIYDKVIPTLPKDKWLICYCDGPQCELGESLAFDLMNFDFSKVAIFKGGLEQWQKSGKSFHIQ